MKRYEYKIIVRGYANEEHRLNRLADEGWRLVAAVSTHLYFERERSLYDSERYLGMENEDGTPVV